MAFRKKMMDRNVEVNPPFLSSLSDWNTCKFPMQMIFPIENQKHVSERAEAIISVKVGISKSPNLSDGLRMVHCTISDAFRETETVFRIDWQILQVLHKLQLSICHAKNPVNIFSA